MANIVEIRGNIFESSCQTIVNTVNCVGVMGKGIAFEYKNRYPQMYQAYVDVCNKNQLSPGLLFLWKKTTPWILNFPTKDHWKYPSKIEYIENGLKKFVDTYLQRGVTSIAFPELGTSFGGLKWEDVSKIMYQHLQPLPNLSIEIYHFDPQAKDTFFDSLYQKVHRFDIVDYKKYIGLSQKQARILKDTICSNEIHSMLELQNIEGIGEKSFEKIYAFINSLKNNRIITDLELQPRLNLRGFNNESQ
ncbi:MAG: macro domain-containing protein [Candidatus Scalindua sp.]